MIGVLRDSEGWSLRIETHNGHIELVNASKEDVLANITGAINNADSNYQEGALTTLTFSRHVGQA